VADGSTTLTAEAGKGYFLDTNTGVIEVFFPTSPSRGDTIIVVDYAGTFATNQAIINTGTNNLDSTTTRQYKLTTNDTVAEFVYVDSAKGWITRILQAAGTTPGGVFTDGTYDTSAEFIAATGGTVTTSGDFKIHTFTGDGNFVVSAAGNEAGSNGVSYMVVAGGGGGAGGGPGGDGSGGGGAGGFREGRVAAPHYTASPLVTTGLTVTATTFPITVGGGGNGGGNNQSGSNGSNSVFSTITSAGGGFGGNPASNRYGNDGGSGGGGGGGHTAGPTNPVKAGNTPPVSPPQGNPGGPATSSPDHAANGGGGANQPGGHGSGSRSGHGGKGVVSVITATPTSYSGGGGGGGISPQGKPGGTGGDNDGSNGSSPGARGGGGSGAPHPTPDTSGSVGQNGTANTGGGGGGANSPTSCNAGSGGKGIVVIRYKFQ
jgi:hypothetical protein